jgi:hypothetical protein
VSRVLVVSGGHIENTKVFINGEEQTNIECIQYEIDRRTKVGILTITFCQELESTMDYRATYLSDIKAFNDEEDDIEFHLDGEIPGTPQDRKPKTLMDVQRELK